MHTDTEVCAAREINSICLLTICLLFLTMNRTETTIPESLDQRLCRNSYLT